MTNAVMILLCTFVNTFGVLDVWLILMLFLKCDMNLNRRNLSIGAAFFAVLNAVVYNFIDAESFWITLFIFVYIMLTACVFSKCRRLRTILMTIPAILIYTYSGIMFDLVEKMLGLDRFQFYYKEAITPSYCISDFLLCVILLFLWKYSREKSFLLTFSKGEGIAIVFLAFMMPEVVLIFGEQEGTRVYTVLWTAFLLTINAMIIYAIVQRKKAAYYQSLSANYRNQFSQEYDFFQNYKETQVDTIKFRHDWKNHMLLLQEMLERNEYDKAKTYFETLSQQTIPCKQNIATGNEIVDMIFSAKADVLENEQISLRFEGKLELPADVQDVDCCILFSNLLDNAIEANQTLEGERYIAITARKANRMFYVEINNPAKQQVQIENHGILTTKEKPEEHGIGLKNVNEIIDKYHGECRITSNEQKFSVQILLPM